MRQLVLLGFVGLAAHRAAMAQAGPRGRFSESLIVRERTFFVDESVLPVLGSAFRRDADDFLVLIDGSPTEVLDAGPDDPPEVTHLVWVDTELASSDSLARAAKLLALSLDAFPDGGEFELVEADAAVLRTEKLTRSDLALRLNQIASEAVEASVSRPTLGQRTKALDRLAAEIPKHRVRDLGAVWLIAEPWLVEPGVIETIVGTDDDETLGDSALGALQRVARVLASRNWVVFPVTAPRVDAPEPPRALMDRPGDEQFFDKGTSPRYDHLQPGGLFRWIFPRRRVVNSRMTPSQSLSRTLDLATEIRLAPMAKLARETSGAQAGDPIRIVGLAERLADRRRLVVLDSSPDPGGLRRVEVSWLGGDGRVLPAIPWFASLAPRELGVSRLLTAAKEEQAATGSPLRRHAADDGSDEICFAYPRNRAGIRVMAWRVLEGELEVETTAEPEHLETGCARLPDDLREGDIVQLEALDSVEWGAMRLTESR